MAKKKSYYDILGIPRDANELMIRQAYRRQIRLNHPDINRDSRKAEKRTRQLNAALEVLTNEELRQLYDAKLARRDKRSRKRKSNNPPAGAAQGHGYDLADDFNEDFYQTYAADDSQPDDHRKPEPRAGARRRRYENSRRPRRSHNGRRLAFSLLATIVAGAILSSLWIMGIGGSLANRKNREPANQAAKADPGLSADSGENAAKAKRFEKAASVDPVKRLPEDERIPGNAPPAEVNNANSFQDNPGVGDQPSMDTPSLFPRPAEKAAPAILWPHHRPLTGGQLPSALHVQTRRRVPGRRTPGQNCLQLTSWNLQRMKSRTSFEKDFRRPR